MAVITLNAKGKSGSDWLQRFSGSTDSVAEYLAQEVLDSRPAKQRDFLAALECAGQILYQCAMPFSNELTVAA